MSGIQYEQSPSAHAQLYKAIGDTRNWICALDGKQYTTMELFFSLDHDEWCIKFRESSGGILLSRKVETFFKIIWPLGGFVELYAPVA